MARKIRIGADELILWLRKNKKASGIPNDGIEGLGRRIYDLIEKLGGKKLDGEDESAFWANEDGDKNVDKFGLPKTAAQYELDADKLTELYVTLLDW